MKKLVSLILATLMLLSMASFAAAEEELTLIFMGQAAWNDDMQVLVDQYYEETGVRVVQENYSFGDMMTTLEVKIGSGSKDYDILSVDIPLVASYASRGMLADMSEYFAADDLAQLVPAAVEAGSYEGAFYASPVCNSSQLLWYNTKLLEEAGIDMTEFDQYTTENRITWERVAEISREVQAALDPNGTEGLYGFDFQQVDRVYQMNQLPNSMGGAQIDETGFSLDGVINTEPWINALTWYQTQVQDGVCSRGINASEIPNYFYSDKVVFMMGTTDMATNSERNNMTWYGFTPAPAFAGYEDKVATPTGSWHYGINAHSEHKEEAAAFIKWLTCGEGARKFYELRQMLPTYLPLLDELAASDDTTAWMKIAITESQTTALPRALTPAFNEYSSVLNAVWSDVRNGEDVAETFDWAIDEYAAQTAKYGN